MRKTFYVGRKGLRADAGLVAILILMFLTSCFALFNAFNLIRGSSGMSILIRQVFWYAAGFVIMFMVAKMNRKMLYKYIRKAYSVLMVCLIYLLASSLLYRFTGHSLPLTPMINGAFSWFRLGGLGFQPSEFIKIVLIVMTARELSSFWRHHPKSNFKDDRHLIWELGKLYLGPLVLIFMQPDTGVCIIITFTLLVMVLCSGVDRKYVVLIFLLIALAVGGFFWLYFQHPEILEKYISSYRLQRIEAWLDPDSHILGSSNQLYTSLLSLGSAGLTGYGLQANIIAIPEAHTDFIFAAFGQCFGLLGTMFILAVCLLLDIYLCWMAFRMRSLTDRYITIGVIAMLLYQQMQNLGMIVGLVPITGVTLPLISYGGSSIISYFIAFGLVLKAGERERRRPKQKRRLENQ